MQNYRYGEFTLADYHASWLGMAVLLIFTIASVMLGLPFGLVIFLIAYVVVWLWTILAPHREQFILCNDHITVLLGKKTYTITLPLEITIVVSYADICPPLTTRATVGNQTHILKNRYAISILKEMPLNVALDALHRNYVRKYTTSLIQTVFDGHRYIYSFVCNQTLFDKLIANRKCLLIIPESLVEKVSLNSSALNVHVDMGY